MSKPIVQHPPDKSTWPAKKSLIVQGFHPRPQNLKATLTGKGAPITGTRLHSAGMLWVFLFHNLPADTYDLSVSEVSGGDSSDRRTYVVKEAHALPYVSYPHSTDTVTQSFTAWGHSDSDLTAAGPQTMVGYDGTGATTDGVIQAQPSQSTGSWAVQFQITDNPRQNTYTLSITNGTGTTSTTRLQVNLNPPA